VDAAGPVEGRIEAARATRSLDLSRCGLHELPDAVRGLTHLESLDLQFNSLDDLPAWLTELDRLTDLNLQSNDLEEVPEVLGSLTGLQVLSLSENNLEGEPLDFLGRLTNLRELALIDTRSDRLPDSIGDLTHLTDLDLYLGWFTCSPESLPETMGQLTGLTRLQLSRNGLTTVPSWIRRLTGLRALGLWLNEITEIPGWIGELTELRELSLPGDPDSGILAVLRGLPHLEKVSFDFEDVELR
jgi:Leucine-rich repeat (LRR) protein